jgi:uncharacterized protein Smg (DUF494 family)
MPPLAPIADNLLIDQENHAPDYRQLTFALMPFALVLLFWLLKLYRKQKITNRSNPQQQAKRALKTFRQRVKKIAVKQDATSEIYRLLAAAIQQYLEERFMRKLAQVDLDSLKPFINQGRIDQQDVVRLLSLLDNIDQYRYASGNNKQAQAADMINEAINIIEAVDKCK